MENNIWEIRGFFGNLWAISGAANAQLPPGNFLISSIRRGTVSPNRLEGKNGMHIRKNLIYLACAVAIFAHGVTLLARPEPEHSLSQTNQTRDGQHDFDFEIGTWKTHLKRRLRPLTGSNTWVEYDGTSVVTKVLNGKANLVELKVDGPAGHLEGISLRLYNPQSRQWSLNFANVNDGTLTPPSIGEFKDGRGEFYNQDTLNGRSILVRFVITDITPNSCRFEQSFSDDGGKTWEVNWIATDTRVKE